MTDTTLDVSHQEDHTGLAIEAKDVVASGKLISQGTLVVDGNTTLTGTSTHTGVATFTAAPVFTAMAKIPSATVAAAGSSQADAAAIATGFTLVSAADGTKGVKLPTAAAGLVCIVKNIDVANAILKVYPSGSGVINALSASAAISLAAKVSAIFVAYDTTTWYTLPLLPS